MKGRPRKFRTNYTRKRNRGDNKTGYNIGNTSKKGSLSHHKRGPIETEESFRKGYLLMFTHAHPKRILDWAVDYHGKKGTEERHSKRKVLFETKPPLDEDECRELEVKLRGKFIQAKVESMGKYVRVNIIRNDRAFREEVEKENHQKALARQLEKAEEEKARKREAEEVERQTLLKEEQELDRQRAHNQEETGYRETNEEREEREERERKKLEFQKYPERRFAWIEELGKTKGFQSTYVIELKPEISKSGSEEAYPSKNLTALMSDLSAKGIFPVSHDPFPQSEMFTDGSRCFYVGQTAHLIEERFYQSRYNHMEKNGRVRKFRKITDEYPYVQSIKHMKSLTGKYGFERSGRGKKSVEFEHYIAWALYKCGYRTWGPTVKELEENNISTDREWLGDYPFL
jgi:hypothetical protein|tara:strand:- start:905 stop:2107 length:1203 start_codon:yes stop_codon:yes gene_type:complete